MKKRIISIIMVLVLIVPYFSVFAEEEIIDLSSVSSLIEYIENYYKFDITREELIEGAAKGVTDVLDKHSKYFTKEEYSDFIESLSGSFVGIGVYIEEEDNYIKVVSPIYGTPAYNAGIKTGDYIIGVDGTDVKTVSFEEAIDLIKGIEDTEVIIKVRRDSEIFDLAIIRKVINIDSVIYEMLDDNIGYIQITQFDSNVSNDFTNALIELKDNGMDSVIIDLRNNPGGYLDEVIKMADWFVDKYDPIVHIDYKFQTDEDYYANLPSLNIPTVVLINGGSASASEIFAAAIKYNEEGKIVGTTSYGKGTVQNLSDLGDGAIKLTVAEYLGAGKVTINDIGVTPDFVIDNVNLETLNSIESFVPMNEKITVGYGNVGLNTYGMQERLNVLGYNLVVDGMFGYKTLNALSDFQIKRNISNSKLLDLNTKLEIEKAIAELLVDDVQLKKAIDVIMDMK